MTRVLTREDFLAKSKSLQLKPFEVPELGGTVYLRELSGGQLLDYNERIQKLQAVNSEISPATSIELMALLISFSACGEDGSPLFTEADVKALAENSLGMILRLSRQILEVSGVDSKAIAEVISNLKKAQTGTSVSGSRRNSEKASRKS